MGERTAQLTAAGPPDRCDSDKSIFGLDPRLQCRTIHGQRLSSVVYKPGKDQEFVWLVYLHIFLHNLLLIKCLFLFLFLRGIVDQVVDGTKLVTQPIGNVVSTGASAVSNTVGGGVNAVGHVGDNFHSGGGGGDKSLRSKIAKLSKDHVSDWLAFNGLHTYRLGFQSNEVDGHALLALLELWKADKSGFLKFAQEALGVKAHSGWLLFWRTSILTNSKSPRSKWVADSTLLGSTFIVR